MEDESFLLATPAVLPKNHSVRSFEYRPRCRGQSNAPRSAFEVALWLRERGDTLKASGHLALRSSQDVSGIDQPPIPSAPCANSSTVTGHLDACEVARRTIGDASRGCPLADRQDRRSSIHEHSIGIETFRADAMFRTWLDIVQASEPEDAQFSNTSEFGITSRLLHALRTLIGVVSRGGIRHIARAA